MLKKRTFAETQKKDEIQPMKIKKATKSELKNIQPMIKAAWKVRQNAYCPYSKFQVGSTLRSKKTGKIYGGCNVENAAYPTGLCAERGALMQLVAHEGPKATIDECVIVTKAPDITQPCGGCR